MAKGKVATLNHARTISRKKPHFGGWKAAVASAAAASYLAHVSKTEYEKPSNSDTNINLNSAFNSTSLYTKRGSKKRKLPYGLKKKKIIAKKFNKKVKKALTKFVPWSTYTFNSNSSYDVTSAPNSNITTQDLFGAGATAQQLIVGLGFISDAGLRDVSHITAIAQSYGHVEDNASTVATARNTFNANMVRFYWKCRMELDIYCLNNTVTDSNPLYVDIYECVAARHIVDVNYANPGQAWTQCHADNADKATFGTDTVDYPNARGNTPFNCPGFSSYWKVRQVTRIRIASASAYHYKLYAGGLWDPRKFANMYAVKGQTVGLMFVACPIQMNSYPANWDFHVSGVSKHFAFKESVFNGKDPIMDRKNTRFVA
jgi:hypothetical protein